MFKTNTFLIRKFNRHTAHNIISSLSVLFLNITVLHIATQLKRIFLPPVNTRLFSSFGEFRR